VTGTLSPTEVGTQVHNRFASFEGASGIASSYALAGMASWILKRKPTRVLEVGAGIGTSTDAITRALDAAGSTGVVHVAVERIPYCVDKLRENIGARLDAVTVVDWPSDAPETSFPHDLVVIDGLGPQAATHLFPAERLEAETAFCVEHLAARAVIIVENQRAAQRRTIEANARPGWAYAHYQPWDRSPGYHLYLFDPTPLEKARLAARQAWNKVWTPGAAKLARRVYRKVTGHRPQRSLAATGPDYSYADTDGDEPGPPPDATEPGPDA
jgi:protein-L-isoaspartate O-methyltransferase